MKKIIFLIRRYLFLTFKIILSIFFVPIIVLTRLISPFKVIRFGKIRSAEYGHFLGATYVYLFLKKKNYKYIDFFYFNGFISNKHWAKIIEKKIRIYRIIELFYIANFFIPGHRKHIYNIEDENNGNEQLFGDHLTHTLYKNKNTHFNLILENENKIEIETFFKKNNINKNSKFVIISSRDEKYKNTINSKKKMGMNFSYHSYMNWNIDDCIPTINYLNKLGFIVIRMGKFVKKKINYKNKLFIDYPVSQSRSDFLDLWLAQNCHFAVCSPSGFSMPLYIFKKPIIFVNCIPFSTIFSLKKLDFFLPKKIKHKGTTKFVSLQNQIRKKYISFKRTDDYKKNNLEVVDNTKKEIKNCVIEYMNKKNKKFLNKRKIKLKKNFNSLVNTSLKKNIRGNISTSFLENNRKWFLKKEINELN